MLIRTRIRRLRVAHDERGIALIMAIVSMAVLAALVVSLIAYTSATSREAHLSDSRVSARDLAEAGLNNALSVLYKTDTPLYANLLTSTSKTYDTGSVTWSGTLDQTQPNTNCPNHVACWMITATGTTRNTAGGSLSQTKTLKIRVPVDPIYVQPLVIDAYDYVFVYGTGDPSGCDFSASNSSAFTSALYVQGNLCLSNSASISEELHVWGTASMLSPQTGIGSSSSYNTKGVHVKNGCKYTSGGTIHSPCGTADHVWANPVDDAGPRTLAPPTIDWDEWYKNANPGPYSPCTTTSGTAPSTGNWATLFDGDQGSTPNAAKRNRSVSGTFNLTPSSAYSCKTAFGEITWSPSSNPPLLTMKGTIFVDGNARIEPANMPVVKYTGVASLYLSGSFVISGTNVCASISGSTCNWAKPGSSPSAWDVANNFLDVVAGGTGGGGQADATDSTISVELKSAGYQGAVTAANRVDVSSQSYFQGPLVERQLTLGQSLTTYPFGQLSNVPTATPGNPVKAVTLLTPTSFSG